MQIFLKRYVPIFLIIAVSVSCDKKNSIDSTHKSNELINEVSPYLLQHAYNPVDWYPWRPQALDKARQEQKLLIISIGFSSCHWCHVMEKETFSDTAVAKLMNTYFVSVKVDKEERPDVDMTYMKAANLILGGGGWPLNIVALPDGRPIFVNTYLPKDKWMSTLQGLVKAYESDRENLTEYADHLAKGIKDEYSVFNTDLADTTFLLKDYKKACLDVVAKIDLKLGGLTSDAEKFPMPSVINLLLEYSVSHQDPNTKAIVQTWLKSMARGGIFDQLGGGFSRYATDPTWTIPHFEKMLYDNAQLLSVYSNGHRIFKDEEFRRVAEMISDFLERELLDSSGGYYSSIDSESGKGEGEYYIWKATDFANIAGADPVLQDYYGITANGNFEGSNVLTRHVELNDLSKKYNQPVDEIKRKIEQATQKLSKSRQSRKYPRKDDKIITSWNALMIIGHLDAYESFGDEIYLTRAKRTAEFIWKNQNANGQISRIYKNGKVVNAGLLDDYANVILAFIKLYENTFDIIWLNRATEVMDRVEKNFKLDYSSLYHYSPKSEAQLMVENIETLDDVMAASNSQLALAKFYLGKIKGETIHINQSKEMLIAVKQKAAASPVFYSNWLRLFGAFTHDFYEVAIVGNACHEVAKEFLRTYNPYKVTLGGKTDETLEILRDKLVADKTLIYVCSDGFCKYPVNSVADALALMKYRIK